MHEQYAQIWRSYLPLLQWGHCILVGQRKCFSLSLWLLYRRLSHSWLRCITGLSEIADWSSRRFYFHCWPPISSIRPLASPHYWTIFLQISYSSTIITSHFLNVVSKIVCFTLLTLRGLCDSRMRHRCSLCSLRSGSCNHLEWGWIGDKLI